MDYQSTSVGGRSGATFCDPVARIDTAVTILVNGVAPSSLTAEKSDAESRDGDDGPWSSFFVQVGTPVQNVRVFVSTGDDYTLVVSTDGCATGDTKCATARGDLFNPNKSTSWQQHGFYQASVAQNLGFSPQAHFGNDTLTLGIQGSGGPTLQNQIVAAYSSTGLYVGSFGTGVTATNFSTTDRNRQSYLSSLKAQNIIPSLSYSYTAGNQYRLKSVFGSLVLGGYDSSLFTPNNVNFTMAPTVGKELTIGIQSLTAQNGDGMSSNLMQSGIMAHIDTTASLLYLPEVVCQQFENAFGLTVDSETGLYLINDTLHTQLQKQNTSVTFTLGQGVAGGDTINITLPYNSFDLVVSPPAFNVGTAQKYFPLRKADNDTQYTIGRVFFQEA